jgi:hypothetical protein
LPQIHGHPSDVLRIQHGSFRFAQVVVNLGRDHSAGTVDNLLDSGQFPVPALGDENNLVSGVRAEIPCDMQVLAWKILVNDQNFHGSWNPFMPSSASAYPGRIGISIPSAEQGCSAPALYNSSGSCVMHAKTSATFKKFKKFAMWFRR